MGTNFKEQLNHFATRNYKTTFPGGSERGYIWEGGDTVQNTTNPETLKFGSSPCGVMHTYIIISPKTNSNAIVDDASGTKWLWHQVAPDNGKWQSEVKVFICIRYSRGAWFWAHAPWAHGPQAGLHTTPFKRTWCVWQMRAVAYSFFS